MASFIKELDKSKNNIKCSWGSETELETKTAITSMDAGINNISVDEFVSLDSCVCLMRDENAEVPVITISINDISRVDIASEGINIEILDQYNNLQETLESEFVDDWEGFGVYYTKYVFPENLDSITLKFTRIKDPNRLWIYGIRLQTGVRPSTSIPNRLPALQEFAKKLYALKVNGEGKTRNSCKNCELQLNDMEEKLNTKIELMENNLKKFIVEEQEKLLCNIKDLFK